LILLLFIIYLSYAFAIIDYFHFRLFRFRADYWCCFHYYLIFSSSIDLFHCRWRYYFLSFFDIAIIIESLPYYLMLQLIWAFNYFSISLSFFSLLLVFYFIFIYWLLLISFQFSDWFLWCFFWLIDFHYFDIFHLLIIYFHYYFLFRLLLFSLFSLSFSPLFLWLLMYSFSASFAISIRLYMYFLYISFSIFFILNIFIFAAIFIIFIIYWLFSDYRHYCFRHLFILFIYFHIFADIAFRCWCFIFSFFHAAVSIIFFLSPFSFSISSSYAIITAWYFQSHTFMFTIRHIDIMAFSTLLFHAFYAFFIYFHIVFDYIESIIYYIIFFRLRLLLIIDYAIMSFTPFSYLIILIIFAFFFSFLFFHAYAAYFIIFATLYFLITPLIFSCHAISLIDAMLIFIIDIYYTLIHYYAIIIIIIMLIIITYLLIFHYADYFITLLFSIYWCCHLRHYTFSLFSHYYIAAAFYFRPLLYIIIIGLWYICYRRWCLRCHALIFLYFFAFWYFLSPWIISFSMLTFHAAFFTIYFRLLFHYWLFSLFSCRHYWYIHYYYFWLFLFSSSIFYQHFSSLFLFLSYMSLLISVFTIFCWHFHYYFLSFLSILFAFLFHYIFVDYTTVHYFRHFHVAYFLPDFLYMLPSSYASLPFSLTLILSLFISLFRFLPCHGYFWCFTLFSFLDFAIFCFLTFSDIFDSFEVYFFFHMLLMMPYIHNHMLCWLFFCHIYMLWYTLLPCFLRHFHFRHYILFLFIIISLFIYFLIISIFACLMLRHAYYYWHYLIRHYFDIII